MQRVSSYDNLKRVQQTLHWRQERNKLAYSWKDWRIQLSKKGLDGLF